MHRGKTKKHQTQRKKPYKQLEVICEMRNDIVVT